MSQKLNRCCKKTGIVLLFVFLLLFCLDGEAYINCMSILPDEIMDLHGYIHSSPSEIEKPVCSEINNEHETLSFTDRYESYILIAYKVKRCFPINNDYLLDSKEILFTFNRYNS